MDRRAHPSCRGGLRSPDRRRVLLRAKDAVAGPSEKDHDPRSGRMTPTTWLPDPSHYHEQMTPLSATTWFEAVGAGLHEAMRELRGPFGGFEAVTEGGWAYEGELEIEWQPDPEGFRAAALDLARRWEQELCPRAHAITDALHQLRPESPTSTEALDTFDHM